jgi:hypothetical protein
MSRLPDDPYEIRLPPRDDELQDDELLDDDGPPADARVPVLDDVVAPGPGIEPPEPSATPPAAIDPLQAGHLHALVREAVDLALDDALDLLRGELHARLRTHLDERLPQLVAEARRNADDD